MLEVISVLPLLTAPVEIPTVTDLLEEKEQELHLLIEENTEQTQQELVQQLEAKLEEREREREEAERQAEQERAEEARRAAEEEARANREALQAEPTESDMGIRWDVWNPIAQCESGYGGEPDWSINTGNGFYGGLQFTLDSWRWVGGEGYPHHASKEEQIYRAEILLERQGWVAWPACSKKVGYR